MKWIHTLSTLISSKKGGRAYTRGSCGSKQGLVFMQSSLRGVSPIWPALDHKNSSTVPFPKQSRTKCNPWKPFFRSSRFTNALRFFTCCHLSSPARVRETFKTWNVVLRKKRRKPDTVPSAWKAQRFNFLRVWIVGSCRFQPVTHSDALFPWQTEYVVNVDDVSHVPQNSKVSFWKTAVIFGVVYGHHITDSLSVASPNLRKPRVRSS
jgi:hypothetical protein